MTVNAVSSVPSSQEKALAPMDKTSDGPPQSMKRARFLINDILSSSAAHNNDKDEPEVLSEPDRGYSPAGNHGSDLPKDLSFHRRSTCGDSSDYDDSESIKGSCDHYFIYLSAIKNKLFFVQEKSTFDLISWKLFIGLLHMLHLFIFVAW